MPHKAQQKSAENYTTVLLLKKLVLIVLPPLVKQRLNNSILVLKIQLILKEKIPLRLRGFFVLI